VRIVFLAALLCASTLKDPARASGAVFDSLGPADSTQSYTFTGSAGGAVGSAAMDIRVTQAGGVTTVIADIWNTSPTTYGSGQSNVAAITGFGIELDPNMPFTSYWIYAQAWNGSSFETVLLGDTNPSGNLWTLVPDSGTGQLQVDMFADNGNGIAAALYNPDIAGDPALGNTNPYFSGAQLIVEFDTPLLVTWGFFADPGCEGNGGFGTPIVRMQRVGDGGSLKLEGESPPFVNPEPQSLVIWALAGGAGLLFAFRSRSRKAIAAIA
jgi:hypothetical protein